MNALNFKVEDISNMSNVKAGALLLASILSDNGGDMQRHLAKSEYNYLIEIYGTAHAALTARKRLN